MSASSRECLWLPAPSATPVGPFRRLRTEPPYVRNNDPAASVLSDFAQEALWSISEDCGLDDVLDKMFRLGVRAFLVAREQQVVGLVTFDEIKGAHAADLHSNFGSTNWSVARCVADVMTNAVDIPMIDWQTVLDATVNDLLEIFEGTQVDHLVVVETDSISITRVRGLIHRRRLFRQLGLFAYP